MTAAEILSGLLPADKALMDIFREMGPEIPESYVNKLNEIFKAHRKYREKWEQNPDEALKNIMAVGNELIGNLETGDGILAEMLKDKSFPWQYQKQVEDALTMRTKWAAEYEQRRRGTPVIFNAGGRRAN